MNRLRRPHVAMLALLSLLVSAGPVQSLSQSKSAEHRDVLAITVATQITFERRSGLCRLLESAFNNGIELEVLGYGQEWHGPGTKLQLMADRLTEPDVGADTVVIFVDAFDVVFVHPLQVILNKFAESGSRFITGAECSCFPQGLFDNTTCLAHPAGAAPYRFLNSGTLIGTAEAFADILSYLLEHSHDRFGSALPKLDDQLVLMELFADGTHGIHVDAEAKIFQTFSPPHYPSESSQTVAADGQLRLSFERHVPGTPEYERCNPLRDIQQGSKQVLEATGRYAIRNGRTNTEPSILHFNGLSDAAKAATDFCQAIVWYHRFPAEVGGSFASESVSLKPLSSWELGEKALWTQHGRPVRVSEICSGFSGLFPTPLEQPMPLSPLHSLSIQ